ncbi:MAG: polysaccharide export outer membrane protein [Paracoccaceae bacterium]|jgi:polysaccharide export outer membrane protein
MGKNLIVTLLALAIGGCGVIYTVPSVSESSGGADVRIVSLTFDTATAANLDPYVPARLPPYFRPEPADPAPRLSAGSNAMPDLPDAADLARRGAGADVGARPAMPRAATQPTGLPGAAATRLPPPSEAQPYRIGIADVVLLAANTAGATLNDVPALIAAQNRRQGYIVQDDGAIAVPDVGRVRIAGLTLEEAEATIFQALVGQRLDPSFSLEIAEFNSQRVSIGGAVKSAELAPISLKPLYLSEALQLAGGVTSTDLDYVVIRLFRNGDVYQVPLRRLYADGGLNDVLLRDGDSVFVDTQYDVVQARAYFEEQLRLREAELRDREFVLRQTQAETDNVRLATTLAQFEFQRAQLRQQIVRMQIDVEQYNASRAANQRADDAAARLAFKDRVELGAVKRDYAYIAGEVRKPSRMKLPFETRASLADILFEDTGFDIKSADYSEIYVLRRATRPEEMGGVTAYHLNAKNAAALTEATVFELRPNDVVFVAEQPVTSWNRALSQLTPQFFLQAVSSAGL